MLGLGFASCSRLEHDARQSLVPRQLGNLSTSIVLVTTACERICFMCQFHRVANGSQPIDVPAVADELHGCSDGAAGDCSLDHLRRASIAAMAPVVVAVGY